LFIITFYYGSTSEQKFDQLKNHSFILLAIPE